MPRPPEAWPDWRDVAAYDGLLGAERPAFAWEWLRRRTDYRKAWTCARTKAGRVQATYAARWGLARFEPPDCPTPLARPVWLRGAFPYVLEAEAATGGPAADLFDLARFAGLATLCGDETGVEHLLLSDGLPSIRIDVLEGSVREGPAMLRYRLAGLAAATEPLLVLRRLMALCRDGRFSPALHPREVRAARWIALLRAADAVAAGASQREIAQALLGREAGEARWRIAAPTLRSRAQRLVRGAREMSEKGCDYFLGRRGDVA